MMTSTVGSDSPADLSERWIRPAGPFPREPRWGHPAGMQLGISPAPRGLLQIFTPYLEHPRERLVNYIAVESVPAGSEERGYSELEPSRLDPGQRGKRMWAVDNPSAADENLEVVEPFREGAALRFIVEPLD